MTTQTPGRTSPFLSSMSTLVDVVLDHCNDLTVVHADATATDVQITLAGREDMLRLTSRLNAAPNVPVADRWTADVDGVRVIVRSTS